MSDFKPRGGRCERCGDPDGRQVPLGSNGPHVLCVTCLRVVESARADRVR